MKLLEYKNVKITARRVRARILIKFILEMAFILKFILYSLYAKTPYHFKIVTIQMYIERVFIYHDFIFVLLQTCIMHMCARNTPTSVCSLVFRFWSLFSPSILYYLRQNVFPLTVVTPNWQKSPNAKYRFYVQDLENFYDSHVFKFIAEFYHFLWP